jgi:hypothetical protein
MAAKGMNWASRLLKALVLLMIVQSAVGVTWGDFTSAECVAPNQRKWYSRLFDIEGNDWNKACMSTPATVNGQYFEHPTNCVNKGVLGEYGEFYVTDATCNNQRRP